MKKTILCIGTLDTKGPELAYIKHLINRKRGYSALVMDISSLGEAPFTADITTEEVAKAAGSTIEQVRSLKEGGPATTIMTRGAIKIAKELYNSGKFQGVISVGGGSGTAMTSAVMRELPIGLPKFMLVSQKIVQAGIRKYVGTKDIVVMPSVADVAGLNRLTKDALNQAAGAITGMVGVGKALRLRSGQAEATEKELVFMTMTGLSTGCGLKVQSLLEERGFEVVVFHTIGVGGETFEDMVKSYPVKGVIELGLNEIGNELLGGMASAGPHRLEAAGEKGIPQIVTPGNVDIINFLAPETLPERYRNRVIAYHNPQATLPRVNAEELKLIGETMAKKLNRATGPVKVLIPLRGFSSLDIEGNPFHDPKADQAFIASLKSSLKNSIPVREIDAHINDAEFAEAVSNEFMDIIRV